MSSSALQGQAGRVLEGLASLASGRFAERMRLEAAARMLVLLRRALDLAERGELHGPPREEELREIEPILRGWAPEALTAAEYVEHLTAEQVMRLTTLGPLWAEA
ncbi:MAG: hypothetical protein N2588_04085, partial [Rhodovarius sp.]|nr:hypothetical protein [Rhodovarius sp.]